MDAIATAMLFATAPAPSPSPVVDPDLVTPGPWGFTAIAFIAAAVTLLIMDMLRRVRRARYREQVAAELDAEQAAADAAAGETGSGESGQSSEDGDGSADRDSTR